LNTAKGLQAQDIQIESTLAAQRPTTNWLAQAIIARDSRRYDEAVVLYEKGLTESPTSHLIPLLFVNTLGDRQGRPRWLTLSGESHGLSRSNGTDRIVDVASTVTGTGCFSSAAKKKEKDHGQHQQEKERSFKTVRQGSGPGACERTRRSARLMSLQ
jgi:hypothetical protein